MTVGDLINQALRASGLLPHGEQFLNPAVTTTSFKAVNRMLESWEPGSLALPHQDLETTLIQLPPGYEHAIVYNLAVELAPLFGVQPSTVMRQMAYESRRAARDRQWDGYQPTPAEYEMVVLLKEARARLVERRELLKWAA